MMARVQNRNQSQLISQASLKPYQLRNDHWDLTFFPEYGCYWKTLQISLEGKWIDLLKPISDETPPMPDRHWDDSSFSAVGGKGETPPMPDRHWDDSSFSAVGGKGETPPFHFGSYLMAPWSNRIVEGFFEFNGRAYQLRKNSSDETAMHGDVRTRPWRVSDLTQDRMEAVLDSREFPDFNYPFALTFKHSLELRGNSLRMSFFMQNVDSKRAPAGGGFHPFFKRRLTDADQDVTVIFPAEKVYPDEKRIPTGPAVSVSGQTDLRKNRPLGNPNLDHCFTGLTGNVIRVIYPGSKVELQYKIGPIFSHVVIYAPSEADGTPRDFVAVEPVTHVTNGFNFLAKGWQETGVKILEPGETWGGSCELSYSKRD